MVEHFVACTTARAAADLGGVHRNTTISFYYRLHLLISETRAKASPLSGEVEVDESYFGGRRKGKRERRAAGKVPVFGILKRGGKVLTPPIPNARTLSVLPKMREMFIPDGLAYTDTLPSSNALYVSSFWHVGTHHSTLFGDRRNHDCHFLLGGH